MFNNCKGLKAQIVEGLPFSTFKELPYDSSDLNSRFRLFWFMPFNSCVILDKPLDFSEPASSAGSSVVVVVVQLPNHVRLFITPWTVARQASLSLTISRSLPKFMSIESMMPSNHLILCHPLLLLILIFPSIRVFSNGSGDQTIGASASTSVFPKSIQDWLPLRLTCLISLLSKGLSRVFSSTTVQKHQLFCTLPSLWSSSHIRTWLLERP